MFDLEGHGGKIIQRLALQGEEGVITKTLPSSLAGTELEQTLKDRELQRLMIIGFMTHMCEHNIARGDGFKGGQNTVLASACAMRILPGRWMSN